MSETSFSDYVVMNFFCIALHENASRLRFYKVGMTIDDFVEINKITLNHMVIDVEKKYKIQFRKKSSLHGAIALYLRHIGYHLYVQGAGVDFSKVDKTIIGIIDFNMLKWKRS